MEIKFAASPVSSRLRLIASPWHTAIVLGVQILLTVRGYLRSHQISKAIAADRISLYERTIFFQWMIFVLVIIGVRLHGSSVYEVLGERWRSWQQLFTDAGVGLLLLLASIMVPAIFGPHSQSGADAATQFLLPRGGAEIGGWIALSLTAGLCEEVLFRGYLQKQFAALTNNAVGIVLSAVLFGAAHGYQGLTKAILIGVTGAILGVAASWRGSTRPGMLAHAAQDLLGGLMQHG